MHIKADVPDDMYSAIDYDFPIMASYASLAVNEEKPDHISIYPNPFTGIFTIDFLHTESNYRIIAEDYLGAA